MLVPVRTAPAASTAQAAPGVHAAALVLHTQRLPRPFLSHSSGSRSVKLYAQQRFATQLIGGGLGANQVFVAGADNQLGARLVQKLLQAGYKVTAGVPDEERANAAVSFATSVELLKKQEAQKLSLAEIDLADEKSIASALPPRGARVIAVVGESGGAGKGAKLDARAATRVLLAAQQVNASQYILVTPSGASGGGGGGLFGGLFGGGGGAGGGSGSRPSKLEQDIAASGIDFAIVRTGRTGIQEADFETSNNVAVGAQGSMPKQARITNNQAANVVQQVIRLADTDVLLEAWASSEAPAANLEDIILEALPAAAIEDEEDEEAAGLPTSQSAQKKEEPEVEVPKTPGGLFGSFGTRRVKSGSDAPPDLSPAGGTQGVKSKPPPKQKEQQQTPKRQPFSFGKKPKADEEEGDNAPYKPQEALKGIFGSSKGEEADIGPNKARKSAAKGIKAAVNSGKSAPSQGKAGPGRPGADGAKPKKGFLASIGLGGETSFVDDEE